MPPVKTKTKLNLEIAYKKLPIEQALALLRTQHANGATHATLRIRWEEPCPR